MSEVMDIVEDIKEIHEEHDGIIISDIEDPFTNDMVSRIMDIPMGNNYQKLHGYPQFRERTKLRLHGMRKDFRAISHRRKYMLKSMEKFVVKQSYMVAGIDLTKY